MKYNPNQIELAYCGGLFDGEGAIVFQVVTTGYKNSRGRALCLSIKMCDRESIMRFYKYTGEVGKIHYRNYKHEKAGMPHWKNVYVITFNSFEIVQFVSAIIWKYIGHTKRNQITSALSKYHNYAANLVQNKYA